MRVELFQPWSKSPDKPYDNRQLINFYLVQGNPQARSPLLVKCTPGFGDPYIELEGSGGRPGGFLKYRNRLFAVLGEKFVEILGPGSYTVLGTLDSSNGNVSIASIFEQIVIVDKAQGYHYNITTNVFQQITDPEFLSYPQTVTAADGYFIVTQLGSDTFAISDLTDGLSWNSASQASAESDSDSLVAVKFINGYLWMLGADTIEIRQDVGEGDVPFQRVDGASSDIGLIAADSVANGGGSLLFLGKNGSGHIKVFKTSGLQAQVISDYNLECQLAQYTKEQLSGAFGLCYAQGGMSFYVLTIPLVNKTYVYDLQGGSGWHERTSIDPEDYYLREKEWRICATSDVLGPLLGMDIYSGNVYELSLNHFEEDGTLIRRRSISPISIKDNTRIHSLSYVQLDLDLDLLADETASITLLIHSDRQLDDEYTVTVGENGDYPPDLIPFWRLGAAREWVLEWVFTDPVNWAIVSGHAIVDGEQ